MIDRFHVMAILQAARAKALGFPLAAAKSFGLNMAIFYQPKSSPVGNVQSYDQVVRSKFGNNYNQAWVEVQKIVGQAGWYVLLSQQDFYELIYRPRRDELVKKWSSLLRQPQQKYGNAYASQIKRPKRR